MLASTAAAVALKADRDLLDAGLFGFNGLLTGVGLNAYLSQDFAQAQFLDPLAYGYLLVAAAFSTVVMAALATHLGRLGLPALTAPFVLATWVFLFAVTRFAGLEAGPLLSPALPEAARSSAYTLATWHEGTFKGVAEIFFQDNWVTGAVVLAGIAVNSRISAAMCAAGALLGVAVAILLGAPEGDVALGLYGFNAALTAIALGGFFAVPSVRAFAYALLGALVTVVAWAWLATALAPVGMPTLTMPFVAVTWLFLAARAGLGGLAAVAPPDATFPEDHRQRARAALREEGRAPRRAPGAGE